MNLKERRTKLGLNQAQLAEALGITQAYVSFLEAGKRTPRDWVIERLERLEKSSPKAA